MGKSSYGGDGSNECPGSRAPRFRWEDEKNFARALLLVVVLWALVGCTNMTPTQQRALSGGAIGAAGGAIVGGSPALGAAIGGAAGTAVGALWEDINKALK